MRRTVKPKPNLTPYLLAATSFDLCRLECGLRTLTRQTTEFLPEREAPYPDPIAKPLCHYLRSIQDAVDALAEARMRIALLLTDTLAPGQVRPEDDVMGALKGHLSKVRAQAG